MTLVTRCWWWRQCYVTVDLHHIGLKMRSLIIRRIILKRINKIKRNLRDEPTKDCMKNTAENEKAAENEKE